MVHLMAYKNLKNFIRCLRVILIPLSLLGFAIFLSSSKTTGESFIDLSFIQEDDEFPQEFVLFTMPKTGTHLMRPILEHLSEKSSISYWCPEINCAKSYLYDKNMTQLFLLIPRVLQAYWLHQPIPSDQFVSILDQLSYTDGFLVTHAPFSQEMEKVLAERNCVVFFLVRDPRDWVISVINHPPISGVDIYGGPLGDKYFSSLDLNHKIHYVIQGTPTYYSSAEVFDQFLPWIKSPICCLLRMEALLGPKGGVCTEEEQKQELRKIADALQLNISDEKMLEAFNSSFGKGTVFSKGKAKSWKDFFTDEHKNHFKEKMQHVLMDLGYEQDDHW